MEKQILVSNLIKLYDEKILSEESYWFVITNYPQLLVVVEEKKL